MQHCVTLYYKILPESFVNQISCNRLVSVRTFHTAFTKSIKFLHYNNKEISTITTIFHMFIKCVSLLFTILLFYIVCTTYGLLGRVPYAAHSVIFIIEEGISYDTFSFILMSICLFWLSREASLPAVMMNRWLQLWPLNSVVAKSNHKTFYTLTWLWWEHSYMYII